MAATANEPSDNSVLPQYKILTLQFNQNCTAFSMGTMTGYKLFSIQPDFKLDEIYDCQYKDVRIIERLFSSSLIAIVSDVEPRKMRMIHYKLGTEICVKLFPSSILSIKLNRDRLVICLEDCLYIYDIHTMELVQRLYEIAPNEDGLFALSPNTDNPYLAYPASSTKGGVQIVNTANKTPKILIPAHDGPLAAIAFDPSGTKIATASTKGTVIRVHSVLDGNCLSEVRRGTYRATIYSLAFSPDSAFLAVSSSSGTIHIFRLVHPIDEPPETATWTNTVTSTVGYVGSYFSKQVTEVLTQDRAYSIVHLQSTTVRTTIAMANFVKRLILFVAGYDGTLIAYEVNTNERGDCRQIHQQIVFNLSENSNQTNDAQPQNERKNSSATTKDAIKS